MREKLEQYVNLLFAGAADCEDIRQEILQNTLDRYDDLIAEGKVPEAAYRIAITGIGDIQEILGNQQKPRTIAESYAQGHTEQEAADSPRKKLIRAIAVGLYILCPIPLFLGAEGGMPTLGLCGTLIVVAIATVLIIAFAKKEAKEQTPEQKLHNTLWMAATVLFFIISFATQAWFITWLIFPICGVLIQLLEAIKAYKEADDNEA